MNRVWRSVSNVRVSDIRILFNPFRVASHLPPSICLTVQLRSVTNKTTIPPIRRSARISATSRSNPGESTKSPVRKPLEENEGSSAMDEPGISATSPPNPAEITKPKVRKARGEKKKSSAKDEPECSTASEAKTPSDPEGRTKFWLMKAEPECRIVKGKDVKFSIDDLAAMPDQTSHWDGVRNHEAKNIMRAMKIGDRVLFYHSNTKDCGIAGLAEVVREAYPDHTAFDATHPYHDPKSDPDKPRWYMVDVRFVQRFSRIITLKELQGYKDSSLKNMVLIRRGRLSVQPVSEEEFAFILGLENRTEE